MTPKPAVHARESKGLLTYSGGPTERPYTLVRRFHVGTAGDDADVPCDDLNARGYMTQIYERQRQISLKLQF
jgi:hypothetical protein